MNTSDNFGSSDDCHWHCLENDEIAEKLNASLGGLSTEEAEKRLQLYGENKLPETRPTSILKMLLEQFSDFMVIVLLVAAVVSGFIGEAEDAIAILAIVLLNAIFSTVQQYRAKKALSALKKMAIPDALAIRDGKTTNIPASSLVLGDVVVLETGAAVPADCRLIECDGLQADEAALTGESLPVEKQAVVLHQANIPLGDRINMAYRAAAITRGRAKAIVVSTGLKTELGKIANLLSTEESAKTPLQLRLSRFGRYLALVVLAICVVVFLAGLLQGQPWLLMLLTSVSLAVAAIPEALPAVVTICLAFGAYRLVKQQALVRNLPAVETLGSITVICSDKTGTLTQNNMTAELVFAHGKRHGSLNDVESDMTREELGRALALNNDITQQNGEIAGEPTEVGLYEAAANAGFEKGALEKTFPRLASIPFESERKLMTTLHKVIGKDEKDELVLAYTKGAPERVLNHCIGANGDFDKEVILTEAEELALEGYRVLALAKREFLTLPAEINPETVESELVFLGLVGLIDPPRPETPEAVADCLSAGIIPVMITGDHPGTALAIARRLGIVDGVHSSVLTGPQLETLSEDELQELVKTVRIFARVSPEQKLRIVKALETNGEFVAMTGDGVNDAPALKRAAIGVAMGQKGTDVARGASDMVLLDDNFATIVRAIKSGRQVFDNIRKFIKDTMTSNSGEIWTLLLAPFLGMPIPLLPIHILWINLITDGLPGLAFTAEPAEPNIMRRPPRPPKENIFAHGMWLHIIVVGLYIGGISLATQAWTLSRGVEYWQTMVFTVLTISQLFHSLGIRSESMSLFRIGLLSNLPMLGAVILNMALQIVIIYAPFFNDIFHTQPLPLLDLLFCYVLSASVLFVVEFAKWFSRSFNLFQPKYLT